MIKILISILNWNGANDTIQCLNSLLELEILNNISIKIFVIDNASEAENYDLLKKSIKNPSWSMFRNEKNLGFAAGHNFSIKHALENNFDYIWLLNNDAVVHRNTLTALISFMENEPKCGSCTPVVVRLSHAGIVDFCGAFHDWASLSVNHPSSFSEAENFCEKNANNLWLVGTALLLRVAAVRQVGFLNEKLFAYYEDNDIGVRLINNGWTNRVVFDSVIEHACFEGVITDRKPYYFYLMTRNSFLFYLKHTPPQYRKLIRLRLIDYSLAIAEKLYRLKLNEKADACLLGITDGLSGKGGPPMLSRKVPLWIRSLRLIGRWWNHKQQ